MIGRIYLFLGITTVDVFIRLLTFHANYPDREAYLRRLSSRASSTFSSLFFFFVYSLELLSSF